MVQPCSLRLCLAAFMHLRLPSVHQACFHQGNDPPFLQELEVQDNQLVGSAERMLLGLRYLQTLNIANNQLTGTLSEGWEGEKLEVRPSV